MTRGRKTTLAAAVALVAALLPAMAAPAQVAAQPALTIMDIQGKGHVSPFVGQNVTVQGVVTALAFNGFFVQDPFGDNDTATSDGIFVFQFGGLPAIGDFVRMEDSVSEFFPQGMGFGGLSITQLSVPELENFGQIVPIPMPVRIGTGGRVPPAVDVISSDEEPVDLQTDPGLFDPANDGIDFYESLEGMLVTIETPVAVSATRTFNAFSSEMFTLANNGADIAPADARTARGGINLQPDPDNTGDQNPERIQIQFDPDISGGAPVPALTVGDMLDSVTGVVDYDFGNFEVAATELVTFAPGGLGSEFTNLVTPDDLGNGAPEDNGNGFDPGAVTLASYNVLNLDPLAGDDAQRATLASHIVDNLATPDIIALQEIQDNSGGANDGTTAADRTLRKLKLAIQAAGGPRYRFFDVAPADGASGGVPGGNIRNAFMFNRDRVKLMDSLSLTPAELTAAGVGDPTAFAGTRDPLVGTFKSLSSGERITVINNHLTSRFGSTPVFGGPQPFIQAGETERAAQTQALNDYVDFLLAGDPDLNVVVLGDLNTMEFTDDITDILPGTGSEKVLTNLIDSLTDDNVYTFNFEGNSQVLDNYLVTDALASSPFDIVHVNVDFPRVSPAVGSDHEPLLALLDLDGTNG